MGSHLKNTFERSVAKNAGSPVVTASALASVPHKPTVGKELVFILKPVRINDVSNDPGSLNLCDAGKRNQVFCFFKAFYLGFQLPLVFIFHAFKLSQALGELF